ncbi:MAG: hypothetical protein KC486_08790 [Myxococcales bacterium]|nr:hypothetical protein [Myxococcales bacterium]
MGDALDREREALLKVQRMRFYLAVGASFAAGVGIGAFTTYQIACSLRPRR